MTELSKAEHRVLAHALEAPGLWCFAVVAARLGLDRALEVAHERKVPDELARAFAIGAWTIDSVPPRETLDELLLGVRLHVTLRKVTKRLPRAAKHLGVSFADASKALATLDVFCGEVLREIN